MFAKLEKRLLNDHRWFGLSEEAQLNYIKLILVAAETYNKIPSNLDLLCTYFRTKQRKSTILKTLKEIELNFPKFKKDGEFYYFEDFHEKTNYIRECPSIAPVPPKVVVDIDIEKEKDIEKEQTTMVGERELIIKDYFLDLLPITLTQREIEAWCEWVDYRKEIKKKLTKRSAMMQVDFLLKQPDFVGCVKQSIQNQWQGLFEVKNGNNKKRGADGEFLRQLVETHAREQGS